MVAGTDTEDVKPKLNLTVVYAERSLKLMVKANTPFKKIFDAFYERFNLTPGTVRFTYEGRRIQADDTPLAFEIEDGDQIDAQVEQVGGACGWHPYAT